MHEKVLIVEDDALVLLQIEGSHFLWKMVRKLVAFLVEVGRGAMTADDLLALDLPPTPW